MEYDELVETGTRFLMLFWAEWASPSVALKERLEGFNRLPVIFVDAEESPRTTLEHGVRALPTLILYEGGSPVKRKVGYDLEETIDGLVPEEE